MERHLQLNNMLITCGFSKQDEMLIDVVMIVQSINKHTRRMPRLKVSEKIKKKKRLTESNFFGDFRPRFHVK